MKVKDWKVALVVICAIGTLSALLHEKHDVSYFKTNLANEHDLKQTSISPNGRREQQDRNQLETLKKKQLALERLIDNGDKPSALHRSRPYKEEVTLGHREISEQQKTDEVEKIQGNLTKDASALRRSQPFKEEITLGHREIADDD